MFFETDSTDLTPTATATLDKQAQWLSQYPRYAITIEGHADERGTREYNFALGARRAAGRPRLPRRPAASTPSRIKTISYGKERPVAVCDDISCWSQNRRAVTVLGGAAGIVRRTQGSQAGSPCAGAAGARLAPSPRFSRGSSHILARAASHAKRPVSTHPDRGRPSP